MQQIIIYEFNNKIKNTNKSIFIDLIKLNLILLEFNFFNTIRI